MRRFFLLTFLLLNLLFGGCGVSAQQEWRDYQGTLAATRDDHQAAMNAWESIQGQNAKSPPEMSRVLRRDVLPRYERIIGRMEDIRPRSAEVRGVHEPFLNYLRTYRRGILILADAMDANRPEDAPVSERVMAEAMVYLRTARANTQALNAK